MRTLLQSLRNPETALVWIFGVLLLGSFFLLAAIEQRDRDLDPKRNVWIVSFENPKTDSLDFIIGNYTPRSDFRWSAGSESGQLLDQGIVSITPGTEQRIPVRVETPRGKIIIRVTTENEQKEIYKIYP
jgi:hypothetical protein